MSDRVTRDMVRTRDAETAVWGAAGAPGLAPAPARLGQYLLQGELGRGGMGTVYRAWHVRLKRPVALKLLAPWRTHDPRALARFHQEMEGVGQLDHPNIVRATDAGEVDGQHFLVMDLVEGMDLARLVRLLGPLPVAEACGLIRQAALGLQHAHEHGLVHRDIKPSNLILDSAGVVKVLDLGIAKLAEGVEGRESLTGTGEVVGTVDYMAPEQGCGGDRVDIRADLYSLGCSLYKLLAGMTPYDGPEYASNLKKLAAHADAPVPSIRACRPDVPEGVDALLRRLLAKAPGDRPAAPAEVAAALAPFAAGADLPGLAASAGAEMDHAEAPTASRGDPGSRTEPASWAPSRRDPLDCATTQADRPVSRTTAADSRISDPRAKPIAVGFDEPDPTAGGVRARLLSWGSRVALRRRCEAGGAAITPGAVLLVAFAMVLVAGLIVGAVLTARSRDAEDPLEAPKPGVPYPLLRRPPRALRWVDLRNSFTKHDEAGRSFLIHSKDFAIFELGDSWDARKYSFAVTIEQTPWTGAVGIFFGWHEGRSQDGDYSQYQTIQLMRSPDDPGSLCLYRTVEAMLRPTDAISTRVLHQVPIARPAPGEHRLAITVGEAGLEGVRWDDREVPGLADPRPNAGLKDADYRGLFGVYSGGSSSVFRKAVYLRQPEGAEDAMR